MKRTFIILFILLTSTLVRAKDVEFTTQAPGQVKQGQRFAIKYTLNAKPNKFYAPDFKNFNVLSGPSTSSSSQIQIINGNMSRSYNYSYTYLLQAKKEGEYNLPPARVKVDGKTYQSNSASIRVSKGKSQASSNQTPSSSDKGQSQEKTGKKLFINLIPDKKNVYLGEAITVTAKIYSQLNLSGINNVKPPSFNGFLKEEIKTPQLRSLTRENIKGETYGTGVLQRFLVFPQQRGTLTIDPYELECVYRKKVNRGSRSIFDNFFGNYQNVRTKIASKPLKINVKALPPNKPDDFTGGVGQFSMSASVTQSQVKTNKAITLRVNISGKGNLKLIDPPIISFPPDFESYDPEINLQVQNTTSGASGKKTFEYLLIPRHAGNFRIPPIRFSFFNPGTEAYTQLSSEEFNIQVTPGDSSQAAPMVSGISKKEVKYIGKDIRFIKTNDIRLTKKSRDRLSTFRFYLVYLVALLIFITVLIIRKENIKQNANIAKVKNKKASKLARKRLKTAARCLKEDDRDHFYEEVLKALWGYLSDKLNIPVSELSKDNITETLQKRKASEEDIEQLKKTVDQCEFARYAPSSAPISMKEAYHQSAKIIDRLENQIK